MASEVINIQGAREHNLKNIDLTIPKEKLVVFTGVSGSGKSSLAFDTLFAEGQRKYVESLSAYARQFLGQLKKPDVDSIEGLAPAIAIEQKTVAGNPRSTIATSAEIYDYLRIVYASIGSPHCPKSGQPMTRSTPSEMVERYRSLPPDTRVILLAPIVDNQRGAFTEELNRVRRDGFVRARVDGDFVELAELEPLNPRQSHRIEVVVDRIVIKDGIAARLSDSIETTLRTTGGFLRALIQPPEDRANGGWTEEDSSVHLISPSTGEAFDAPRPKSFSFNAPNGACPECQGLGRTEQIDPDLVLPDPNRSIADGAIAPWSTKDAPISPAHLALVAEFLTPRGVSVETPIRKIPKPILEELLRGPANNAGDYSFPGLIPTLQSNYDQSESATTRKRLKRYMNAQTCPACHGRRLRPESLAVTLGADSVFKSKKRPYPGASIIDVTEMTISQALEFFEKLPLTDYQLAVAGEALKEIRKRLTFLESVGVGYLSLNRASATLSGGEAQRIRLATQIGGGLSGALYVLDEPSIGLHQRDNERLLRTLENLRDLGNSVVIVEHDEDTIRRADHIVDFGLGAGRKGGSIIAQGDFDAIAQSPDSVTGKYLRGDYVVESPSKRLPVDSETPRVTVTGASENNLKGAQASFPIGRMTCVTGVSGSGKSTLVHKVLHRALAQRLNKSKEPAGRFESIEGWEILEKTQLIDQTPIGKSPRSNPASYTGVFDEIRRLFSSLPSAKIRGYAPGRFSFNVKGGRCEKCQGDGLLRIDMHFLPPAYVPCETCEGRRFNRETLEIKYKGLSIADTLDLSVNEAAKLFRAVPKIVNPLRALIEIGLGYLELGQSAATLSGGEAQRLKIAAELGKKSPERTLYILDEPTTGLHFHDISTLIRALMRLRDIGGTIIIIEHNLDMIKVADWVIDLGPGAGVQGGNVVAAGPPEAIAQSQSSETGRFLNRILNGGAAS